MVRCSRRISARSRLIVALVVTLLAVSDSPRGASRPQGWRDDTHSRTALPDYDRVFPSDRVNRLDIIMAPDQWTALVADMAEIAGAFGAQRQPGAGGGFGGFPEAAAPAVQACSGLVEGATCTLPGAAGAGRCTQQFGGVQPALACVAFGGGAGGGVPPGGVVPGGNVGGGGGPGGPQGNDDVELFPRSPAYVPVEVRFDGVTFQSVGFRLKGNSSLSGAWRAGSEKLPFRLNFDYFEDTRPEIRDQRFFGFPNLAFTNNGTDTSFLRQRVVTDLFIEAGLPAVRTAFVRVFLDRGNGPVYLGLYTLTEVPDEPFLDSHFGSNAGNLYKPNGTGARWTRFIEASFPKKTNAFDEDWTDIQDAIAVLNESRADAAVWRRRLEARFEVDAFLRWLALSTIVANNDTYGGLSAHNYYLYGSPRQRDRLFWIAWDHDLAMSAGGAGGPGGPGGVVAPGIPGRDSVAAVDLMRDTAAASWPLIRLLLDDPVYRAAYRAHVDSLLRTVFDTTRLQARIARDAALIAPYVVGPEGEQTGRTFLTSPDQFATSVEALRAYVASRATAVRLALAVAR